MTMLEKVFVFVVLAFCIQAFFAFVASTGKLPEKSHALVAALNAFFIGIIFLNTGEQFAVDGIALGLLVDILFWMTDAIVAICLFVFSVRLTNEFKKSARKERQERKATVKPRK